LRKSLSSPSQQNKSSRCSRSVMTQSRNHNMVLHYDLLFCNRALHNLVLRKTSLHKLPNVVKQD
jgi:hypothetical protein